MNRLLTVTEVAERLRVSRTTVYQLVEKGLIATHRVGTGRGSIRVSESDLTAYLEACRVQKQPQVSKSPPRRLRHLRL